MTRRPGSSADQNVIVDDSELLASLLADVATIAGILRSSAGADVPSCPGWSVADLVSHHGGVLRWAARIVEAGEPVAKEFPGPGDLTERAEWYSASAAEFVDVARSVDRDRGCWTFGRPPGKAWFWTRRQAMESAIHRWDAERACGGRGDSLERVAASGITEVVEDLFPRQVALGRSSELSGALSLQATDTHACWVLGSERSTESIGTVEAPAAVLMLLLWGRATLDDHRVSYSGPARLREEIRACRFAP